MMKSRVASSQTGRCNSGEGDKVGTGSVSSSGDDRQVIFISVCVCVSHLRDQAGPVGRQLFQILLFSRLCSLLVHLQTTTSCTQSQFSNITAKSLFLLTDKGLIRKIKTL